MKTSLEAILREGQAAGPLSLPDTKIATLAIIAMLTGVTTWYREGGRLSRAAVGDHLLGDGAQDASRPEPAINAPTG